MPVKPAPALLALALLAAPAAAQEQIPAGDPVVATINGAEIRLSEIAEAQRGLPDQYRQMPLPVLFEPLLDRVIDARLLADEAERENLDAAPELQPALAQARAQVLREALIEQRIEDGLTEDRLRARYDELSGAEGFEQEEVHAQHVLLESEAEAQSIIEQVEGGGEFEALAREHSTDPSAQQNGGDLGYFTREQMVPEFATVAFELAPGEVSPEPVQSQFGWHVIKVLDKRTRAPSFEESEPELREVMAREIVTALLTDLRDGAEIERFGLDGEPLPDEPAAGPEQPPAPGQPPAQEPQQ